MSFRELVSILLHLRELMERDREAFMNSLNESVAEVKEDFAALNKVTTAAGFNLTAQACPDQSGGDVLVRRVELLVALPLVACGPSARGGDNGGADGGDNGGSGSTVDAAACHDVVDVVFVRDVSSSMSFVLDKLGTDMEKVVTGANGLASDAHFGLIAYVDNYVLDTTGPLEGGKVHTAAATLKTAFAHYKATYTTPNRQPGDGPSGRAPMNPICEENALDSLSRRRDGVSVAGECDARRDRRDRRHLSRGWRQLWRSRRRWADQRWRSVLRG